MKRRNFLGSLFAAGAVVKDGVFAADGEPNMGSGEVVTPVGKLDGLFKPKAFDCRISGKDLLVVLEHNKANKL